MRNHGSLHHLIIGLGDIAHTHAAELQRQGERLSFCSRDPHKAAGFQQQYGGLGAFTHVDEALRQGEVDSCVICVPHHLHEACVRDAVRHHTHILLEKPIAHTLASARRIVDLAATDNPNRTLMIAEQLEYVPVLANLQTLVRSGRVVDYVFRDHSAYRPSGWRTRLEDAGGGVMLDLGIHWVSLAVRAFGPVASHQRVEVAGVPQTENPAAERLFLRHVNGIEGEVDVAWVQPAPRTQMDVRTSSTTFTYRPWGRFARLGAMPRFVCLRAGNGRRAMTEAYLAQCRGTVAPADMSAALDVLSITLG